MIPCTGCHRLIYDAELACPFCGTAVEIEAAPLPASERSRSLALVVCVALGSLSSACWNDTTSATTAVSTEDASQTSEQPQTNTSDATTEFTATQDSTNSDGDETVPEDESMSTGVFYGCSWDTDFGGVSECDPFAQDCPEGEKCVPAYDAKEAEENGEEYLRFNVNECVPIVGEVGPGEVCNYDGPVLATDDCDQFSHCLPGSNDGPSTCSLFCLGTADDWICPPDTACLIAYAGSMNLCLQTCDPLLQDCSPQDACAATGSGEFVCVPPARDSVLDGEPCYGPLDCASGLCVLGDNLPGCESEMYGGCCTSWCDLEAPDCAEGLECTPYFDEDQPDSPVGVCFPPEN